MSALLRIFSKVTRLAVLSGTIFFLMHAATVAQTRIDLPVPDMPASPQKVLADIGSPADVQAAISGGWGYSRRNSMIIGNPYHGKNQFFDVQAFEAELIELRNMEEFYTVPADGERYFPLRFLILKQTVHTEPGGRRFDQVNAKVDLLPEEYWPALDNLMDQNAPEEQIFIFFQGKLRSVNRNYWFDITLPYTDNAEFYAKPQG